MPNVASSSQSLSLSAETTRICFKDAVAIDVSRYKFFSPDQVNSFVN
jgi:hypothetical protein